MFKIEIGDFCLNRTMEHIQLSVPPRLPVEHVGSQVPVLRLNERVSHPVVVHGLAVAKGRDANLLPSVVPEDARHEKARELVEAQLPVLEVVERSWGTREDGERAKTHQAEGKADGGHAALGRKKVLLVEEVAIGRSNNLVGSVVIVVGVQSVEVEGSLDLPEPVS